MRYRTEIEFGVPDFTDLLKYEVQVGKILQRLGRNTTIPGFAIEFSWDNHFRSVRVGIDADDPTLTQTFQVPGGVSAADWAKMLAIKLENYLVATFKTRRVIEGLDGCSITVDLVRI